MHEVVVHRRKIILMYAYIRHLLIMNLIKSNFQRWVSVTLGKYVVDSNFLFSHNSLIVQTRTTLRPHLCLPPKHFVFSV